MEVLTQIETALMQPHDPEERKYIKTLLYHADWYVRREAALLIDRFGIPLNESEQWQFAYALQNFSLLYEHRTIPQARQLLFTACTDAHPRLRSKAAGYLTLDDCQTLDEEVAFLYATGDYLSLIELGCSPEGREPVIQLLKNAMQQADNPNYHRRQCAYCLEQLEAIDDAQEQIAAILSSNDSLESIPQLEMPPPQLPPLEQLIYTLRHQGIWLDGQRIFPEIQVGTVTGRITYKNPPLQTIPAEDRLRRLSPEQGNLLCLDYKSIEPTIFLHYLVTRFYLGLDAIPDGDLYLAINPGDRAAAKRWFNTIINGGSGGVPSELTPFQLRLLDATREFQQDVLNEVYATGYVETIGGRRLPAPQEGHNRLGKIMSRLIQGSASDVFHKAIVQIHQYLMENALPLRIYFLLFDEVWILGKYEVLQRHQANLVEIMQETPEELGIVLPIGVHQQLI